ncbi:cytochrome c1 [Taklimakanibacter deserti]|uniref:cytochrome c1 n=1 Tax=Taklimakanibacter deserti TaxID=2267839 RepID=UPI000E650035
MKLFTTLAAAAFALIAVPAFAAEGQKDAKDISYSFEGPFGTFDKGQLQRGYKVYKEVCAACHSMRLLHFRNLDEPGGPGFTEEQVKALAATFTVKDGPGEDGEMFDRPGLPSDRFPSPFPNEQAARNANGGALPPDLSLITKSRAGWYGTFNQLVNGIGGPEYVYSVLTGFEQAPPELAKEAPEGKHFNPYFASGHWIGMAPPLVDGQVTFDDGAPNKIDDMARDVSAFLAWAAEPKMEERKSTGFATVIYLAVLAVLLYLVKQRVWARVDH